MNYIPDFVVIESTSICNLHCNLCPINHDTIKKAHMEEQLFYDIIDKINCKTTVSTFILGETTLHPKFHAFAKYMNEKRQKYYLITNGMLWKNKIFNTLTNEDSNCYQVIFSVDGLYNTTNDTIRKGSNLEKVKENIEKFIKLKKERKANLNVGVKLTQKGQEYKEIEDFIYYWLKKVDFVCISKLFGFNKSPFIRRQTCRDLYNGLFIRADGSIIRCCHNDIAITNQDTFLGNINEYKTITEAFNSEKHNKLRLEEKNGNYSYPCDSCNIPICGDGFYGLVTFRDPEKRKNIPAVYWHNDAMQEFYSLTDVRNVSEIFKIASEK